MIRVYKYGLLPPTQNINLVRDQFRAAHEYRNLHVEIERGRRAAVRELFDTEEIRIASELLSRSSGTERLPIYKSLAALRSKRLKESSVRVDEIEELAAGLRRGARALTRCYWGSYLTIEAASDQVRKMPLYGRDGITPNDPRFIYWSGESQIGVQLQGGLTIPVLHGARDTRLRLERVSLEPARGRHPASRCRMLWIRIGSEGRSPIWATFPLRYHRELPTNATIKWARVSLRREGLREEWSCEITIDIPGAHPRTLDTSLTGAIAVSLEWTAAVNELLVARTLDCQTGEYDELRLPARMVTGLRKPDGIRSVRDKNLNELRPRLIAAFKEPMAPWLAAMVARISHWRSPDPFHALAMRWRREKCDDAREAYDVLQTWELRDAHLWDYEAGSRREALRERRELYRVWSAKLSRRYKTVVLSDADLSVEARTTKEVQTDRQTAAVYELRQSLRNAFAGEESMGPGSNVQELCDRWNGEQTAGNIRNGEKSNTFEEAKGGAWAKRKAKKSSAKSILDATRQG